MDHSNGVQVQAIPSGVQLLPLQTHGDERGNLTEIFRETWPTGICPVQWTAQRSYGGVLRGVHVHIQHVDYVVVLAGQVTVGLKDLRRRSPTEGMSCLLLLSGDKMMSLCIPIGVAHGFYSHEPSLYVIGASQFFDPEDDLGCRWSDPDLAIDWPVNAPVLSARDRNAPPLSDLLKRLLPHQPLYRG
jgi:dTDP-4-dehydrorhamnose 3,5-epimerase